MNTSIPIPGPLSLGELLDRAFRLYRSRFASFVITAAIFLIPFAIVSALVTGSAMVGYFDMLQALSQTPVGPPDEAFGQVVAPIGDFIGATMLMTLIGFVVNALVLLALTAQGIAALTGHPIATGEAVRIALRRFWSYVGMTILSSLAFLGVAVVIGIAFLVLVLAIGGLGGLALAFSDSPGANVALGVGMFAMIMCVYAAAIFLFGAPLLYLVARWFVATPGIIDQEWGASAALGGSWRLTKGFALRCMGYAILLWVLSMVIMAAPLYMFQWIMFILLPMSALVYATGLSVAISSILSVLWQPLAAIAVVLLYYDLRVRQESYDLSLRVEQMEAEMNLLADGPRRVLATETSGRDDVGPAVNADTLDEPHAFEPSAPSAETDDMGQPAYAPGASPSDKPASPIDEAIQPLEAAQDVSSFDGNQDDANITPPETSR